MTLGRLLNIYEFQRLNLKNVNSTNYQGIQMIFLKYLLIICHCALHSVYALEYPFPFLFPFNFEYTH